MTALSARRLSVATMITLAVLVSSFVLAATAGSAGANVPGDYNGTGVNIRVNPDINSSIAGKGYPGQGLSAVCYLYEPVFDPTKPLWVYHTNKATGVQGWSDRGLLSIGSQLPKCYET